MSEQALNIKFKKKDGKLIIPSGLAKEQYKIFLSNIEDGTFVEAVFEVRTMDNTKAQLAKIHVMIKIMADEQGSTIKEMKNQVKDECGMKITQNGKEKYQSFGNCSKDELSNVIESIIQMASFLNINLEEF